MQPVASATHAVLLTSGTLSPMEPLLAELGLDGSSLLAQPTEAASRAQRRLGQQGASPTASAAAVPGPSTDGAQGSASAGPGQPGPLCSSPSGPSSRAAAAAGSGSKALQLHQGLAQQQQQPLLACRASGPVPRTSLYFSSPHHSSLQGNLLALSISHVSGACGAVPLNSGFKHRGSPEYLTGLGSVLLAACASVPHGVLCFFPAWGLLHAATAHWKQSGGLAGA